MTRNGELPSLTDAPKTPWSGERVCPDTGKDLGICNGEQVYTGELPWRVICGEERLLNPIPINRGKVCCFTWEEWDRRGPDFRLLVEQVLDPSYRLR